ncbi:MAG: menaquinone biosynthesis protein [Phycisphaerae bacterium]|nr:menaquinone biosynthesis protein [Phycisphaerae bacterium]
MSPMIRRADPSRRFRVAAVRFLNARPLIFGLSDHPSVQLVLDVPSALGAGLDDGRYDVAMTPAIDYARAGGRWAIVPAGCIASDAETLTVRIFSRVPIERIETLAVDADSHTSVALATLILKHQFSRSPRLEPADMADLLARPHGEQPDSVLLIGDKVVSAGPNDPRSPWPVQLDLGLAWREWTGLPFVFAVWSAQGGRDLGDLPAILAGAKSAGLANRERIAREAGPSLGWPVDLALTYMTRHLQYDLTAERLAGMERFIDLAREAGLA